MVYRCTQQHFDLVSSDYYAQELKYQEVIDGSSNLKALNQKITIADAGNAFTIELPVAAGNAPKGEIYFYRPSNAAGDFRIQITPGKIEVPKSKMLTGLYKVKVTWTNGDKKYFDEQTLTVR
jgi:hypothetical protein